MKKQQKKKKRSTLKKFNIDVYGVQLHVGINYSAKTFDKTYFTDRECTKKVTDYDDHFDSKAFTWGILSTKKEPRVVFVNVNLQHAEGKTDLVDTIGHEAFHVASEILRWAGLHLSDGSEEAYAYLIGYVTACIYKAVFEV